MHDFFRQGGTIAVAVPTPAELEVVGLINVIVVPGEPPSDVVTAAVAAAEARGALCILDPPAAWTTVALAAAGAEAPGFARSPNVAVYFPRITGPGPVRGPAGAVAGVLARFDVLRGVWTPPAGVEAGLRGVEQLEVDVNDAGNGVLNPLGVNCLRTFAGAGPVVWGSRTTATEGSDWKYVSVRRTALFLEHSLARGLQWARSEVNDERLWARIRAEADAFLDGLLRDGAFSGSAARDAYFVKCDGDTTTDEDVAQGVVNVVVGFAPLRPGEFVVLRLRVAAATAGAG